MQDESREIVFNEPVILHCAFDTEVNCAWSKDDNEIDVGDDYIYVDSADGKHTTNCNLMIKRFTSHDVGSWMCTNYLTSSQTVLTGSNIRLSGILI